MNAPVPRYVIGISGRTAETLAAQANALGIYLDAAERDTRRAAFANTVTLAAVAKTLLRHREGLPHRFAFVAATLADAVESLRFFAEHQDSGNRLSGKGIYASRVETNLFGEGSAADQDYVRQLATDGSYDRLAALWSVGFPIDWSIVHPELDVELPAYLPPTPLSRQRFWPAPATSGRVDSRSPQQPGQPSPIWATAPTVAPVSNASTATPTAGVSTETPATFTPAPSAVTPATAPTIATRPSATAAWDAPEISTGDLRSELADLPSALRRQLLRTRLQGWIGAALAYPDGELPVVDMGFFDIGMTSIHLEEVRTRIAAALGLEPEETTAFDYPTITEFADYLERSLDSAVAQPVSAHQLPPVRVDNENVLTALDSAAIDELSPVELERVLTAIL